MLLNLNLEVVADHPYRVGLQLDDRRERLHVASADVEARAVERALDNLALKLALGQRRLLVGTNVGSGVVLAVDVKMAIGAPSTSK